MTRTSQFDFGSGLDPDLAYQWDTKCKPFSLTEVCALPSAALTYNALLPSQTFPEESFVSRSLVSPSLVSLG